MSFIRHGARVVLKDRYGVPSAPHSLIEVQADSEWQSATARGKTAGLRRYSLGEFDADDLDGTKRQRRAIGPDFVPRFTDSKVNDWTVKESPEMRAERELALDDLQARQLDLEAVEEPTEAQLKQLADLRVQVEEFSPGGSGYKETVPDAFGDGTVAMYHRLGSPDVPSRYISNDKIDEDACHSLRLYAWKPVENGKWEFSYTWSWWRLVISDKDVTLIRFNEELSAAQRQQLERQITTLEDRGRITAVDQKYINEQRAKIDQIKGSAEASGRSKSALTDDEKLDIQTLENNIDTRREAKRGLTRQQEAQLDTLKKQLYRDSARANLYSAGKDFFNQPITITFIPDARGYLIIVLGDQVWSYTDKQIRKSGYRGTMWDASRPEIACSGGPYVWQPGAPEFRRETILELDERRFPFSNGTVTWDITGDWDSPTDAAKIEFLDPVLVAGTGTADIPAKVLFKIKFTSDGTTPAMLHNCTYYAPPGERTGTDAVYFDSDQHLIDGEQPIEDLELSYDDERDSVTYNITMLDPDGFLAARDALGRVAEVWVEDADGMVKMEGAGIVKNSLPKYLAAPDGESDGTDLAAEWRADSRLELVIGEQWDIMDSDIIHDQVPVDGMRQGKALRLALAGRGARDSEILGVDPDAGIILGKAPKQVGEKTFLPLRDKPLWRPGDNVRRGAWLRRIQGVDTSRYLHLVSGVWTFSERDLSPVATFSSNLSYDGRFQILDEVELPDDASETFNVFTVVGGINEATGKRITMTRVVYESLYDSTDLRYLGYEKWYKTESDEALTSEEMVMNRLDVLERDFCKPTKMISVKSFFHTILRPKRVIMIRGLKYQIKTISKSSMALDDMTFTARRVLN